MDTADELDSLRVLKARYFRHLDAQDWPALRRLFTDEVEIDVSGDGGGVVRDPDEFVGAVRVALDGARSVHHGHMPELELTSDTTARGVWAMEDRIWFPEGSPVGHLHGFGHYHETYRKLAGVWRIETMRLTRLRRELDGRPA